MERDRIDEKTSNILFLLESVGFEHIKEHSIIFRGFNMKISYLDKKIFFLTHPKSIDIEIDITKCAIKVDTTSEKMGFSAKILNINDYVLIFKYLKTLLNNEFRKIIINKIINS